VANLDSYGVWERCGLDTLARPELTAEAALDLIAAATEEVREWRPGDGDLTAHIEAAFAHLVAVQFKPATSFAAVCAAHFPPASGPVPDFEPLWDCLV